MCSQDDSLQVFDIRDKGRRQGNSAVLFVATEMASLNVSTLFLPVIIRTLNYCGVVLKI